jgi:signal transduction histidine kinase
MMEKVLALVVHDIRNPLTIIKSGVQIILNSSEQLEKNKNILQKIVKSIDHANSTITLVFETCDLNVKSC